MLDAPASPVTVLSIPIPLVPPASDVAPVGRVLVVIVPLVTSKPMTQPIVRLLVQAAGVP